MDLQLCGYIYKDRVTKELSLKCVICLKFVNIKEWSEITQQLEKCCTKDDEEACLTEDIPELRNENENEDVLLEEEVPVKDIIVSSIEDIETDICDIKSSEENGVCSENDYLSNDLGSDSDCKVSTKPKAKINFCLTRRNYKTKSFIEILRGHSALWNSKSADFFCKKRRSESLKLMKLALKDRLKLRCSLAEIEVLIKNLSGEYKNLIENTNMADLKNKPVCKEYMELCSFLKDMIGEIDDESKNANIKNERVKGVLHFGKVNKNTFDFARVLRSYPELYEPSNKNYSNKTVRLEKIINMQNVLRTETDLRLSDEQIIRAAHNLKRWYNKTLDIQENYGSKNLTEDHLLFLEKCKYLPRKNLKQKISCPDCQKIFFTHSNMKVHRYNVHKTGELPFKCDNCDRSFSQKSTLTTHQQRYHIGKTLQCQYCARPFAVLIDLQRHMATHKSEKPFVCEICGKSFRFKIQLGYHVTAIHTKIRAYKCSMCPKDFLKPVHLRDHIKSHLDIRDKICETCGKGFTNCHSLIRHRQIHSDVKKFPCKLCDAKFHQFVGLISHMKRTHNVVKSAINKN